VGREGDLFSIDPGKKYRHGGVDFTQREKIISLANRPVFTGTCAVYKGRLAFEAGSDVFLG